LKYIIGIDLGTTAIKIGIFDENAVKIGISTEEYGLITESEFKVEQNASIYWEAFKTCLNNVLVKTQVLISDILALSISSQGETLVFIDDDGKPLHNVIVWMDNRAQEEA